MLTHALYASPGDVKYEYYPKTVEEVAMGERTDVIMTHDIGGGVEVTEVKRKIIEKQEMQFDISMFDFEINPYRVRVADTGLSKKNYLSYFAYLDKDFGRIVIEKPDSLRFIFEKGDLSVENIKNE